LFTGLFATTLAFWVQTEAQRFTSAVRVVLIFSLEPVFAAIAGWWLHGDQLRVLQFAGAGLMFTGSVVAGAGPLLAKKPVAQTPI
jgi:drug/metabolite transporter (DMT)-like permease